MWWDQMFWAFKRKTAQQSTIPDVFETKEQEYTMTKSENKIGSLKCTSNVYGKNEWSNTHMHKQTNSHVSVDLELSCNADVEMCN